VLTLMHAILFKEIFMLGKRGVTLAMEEEGTKKSGASISSLKDA